MNKNGKLSIFKFFISTYMIIMLIPLTTCAILYCNLFSIINKNNEDKYYSTLSQAQQIANQYLDGISNIPSQILSNTESASFLNNKLYNSDIFNKPSVQRNIISHLNSYTSSNPLIDNIYLFSSENDCFLSSETSISASSYGSFFKVGDMDYYTFKATVLSLFGYNRLYNQTDFFYKGLKKKCFYLVTTVPLQENRNITGAILISIDTNELFKTAYKDIPDGSFFYFYNNNGSLIAKSENAPKIAISKNKIRTTKSIGKDNYTIYQTNFANSYNCSLAVLSKTVTADINKVRTIITLSLFAGFIICGLLALYFTRINTRSVRGILNTLLPYAESTQNSQNEYLIISDSVNKLISTNKHSMKLLYQNLPVLQSNFLHSILSGDLLNEADISQSMKNLDISFNFDYYIVLIVSLLPTTESKMASINTTAPIKVFLSEKISLKYECLHTHTNEEQMVFAICLPDNAHSLIELENELNSIANDVNNKFCIKLKLAVSSTFTSFSELFYEYHEAKSMIDNGIQTVYDNSVWCTKSLLSDNGYYYPPDVEKRIISSFQRKSINIVFETLDNVLKENYEKRVLSVQTLRFLYSNIKCTVFKILYGLSVSQEITTETENAFADNSLLSLPDYFDLVKKVLEKLYELTNECSSEDMTSQMLQYIDQHYNNPSLSRSTFSNHFHISEAYASKFFKEYTGYQFIEYVTKVRMEAACKFLNDSNFTIDKIAKSVGYNSDVSFRRAFKAYVGMTPKEYRNSIPTD